MKNTNKSSNINIKRIFVISVCILLIGALTFCFVACSKDETNPANFENNQGQVDDTTPENGETPSQPDNPTGDNDNPSQSGDGNETGTENGNESGNENGNETGDEPTDNPTNPDVPTSDALQEFAALFASVDNLNAVSEISVTFGGRILAKETIEYTRTASNGTIKTTTVSLDTANAKDPYKTEESQVSLSKTEFESKFPKFVAVIQKDNFKDEDYELAVSNGTITLTFTVERTTAQALFDFSDAEANSIATDISVEIVAKDNLPLRFVATYKTSNGNTIEIKTVYSSTNN